MTSIVRLLAFSATVAVVACGGKDRPSSPVTLPRAALDGSYSCDTMFAFFRGSQGPGWQTGSCRAYVLQTDPSRQDSAETQPLTILPNNTVTRPDFSPGILSYDSTTRVLRITYTDRPADVFSATVDQSVLYLGQRYAPFDFSGDGTLDSLILVFRKDP